MRLNENTSPLAVAWRDFLASARTDGGLPRMLPRGSRVGALAESAIAGSLRPDGDDGTLADLLRTQAAAWQSGGRSVRIGAFACADAQGCPGTALPGEVLGISDAPVSCESLAAMPPSSLRALAIAIAERPGTAAPALRDASMAARLRPGAPRKALPSRASAYLVAFDEAGGTGSDEACRRLQQGEGARGAWCPDIRAALGACGQVAAASHKAEGLNRETTEASLRSDLAARTLALRAHACVRSKETTWALPDSRAYERSLSRSLVQATEAQGLHWYGATLRTANAETMHAMPLEWVSLLSLREGSPTIPSAEEVAGLALGLHASGERKLLNALRIMRVPSALARTGRDHAIIAAALAPTEANRC